MDDLSPEELHQATLTATSHVTAIADMLRVIRDHVAPMISEYDLKRVDTRHSVRARISPHPTLRRATLAAEAAQAAIRRTHECVSAARCVLDAAATHLSREASQAEARHWMQQAMQHIATVARAHSAVSTELARVKAGIATIAEVPPPAAPGPARP